jgi:hypothetical protein
MKEPLRAQLAAEAKDHGISVNAEVVRRLEQTLNAEQADIEKFGGPRLATLFHAMGAVAKLIEQVTEKPPEADWDTEIAVREAWRNLISRFFPGPQGEDLLTIKTETPPLPKPKIVPAPQAKKVPYEGLGGFTYEPIAPEEIARYEAAVVKAHKANIRTMDKWMKEFVEPLEKLRDRAAAAQTLGRDSLDLLPQRRPKGDS